MSTQLNNPVRTICLSLVALMIVSLIPAPSAAQDPERLSETRATSVLLHNTKSALASKHTTSNSLLDLTDLEGRRPREDLDDAPLVRTAISSGTTAPEIADEAQLEITARYQDAKMLNFLSRANTQQLTQLFYEASNLIDTRHVNPLSYEERTRAAIEGLVRAVENPAFLTANGVSPSSQAVRELQSELNNLARTQPARSVTDALGVMQWAEELANRRLGLRPEAVALEFLNETVDSLDEYSAFMPGDSPFNTGAVGPQVQTAGLDEHIVGIGVEMKAHDEGALVVDVIDGGPAAELGLRSGDLIVAVDRKPLAGLSLSQIAEMIGGRAGTSVTLDIQRDDQTYRGSARRRQVYVSSVSGVKMADAASGVGYIRLKQFSASSSADLEKALWTLHRQGMKSLILDLRGNPGGLLDQAIAVSDLFVPRGTIVSTRGRNASDNTSEAAHFAKTWAVPLVVLVDENSASASEIFAAAIQDNGRGPIVGRQTYGKGTVQTHFPLTSTQGLLKLTTARFYSPTGREMAGSGVTPDLPVNAHTTAFRGTKDDPDLAAALKLIRDGVPAQMVSHVAQGNGAKYRPDFDAYRPETAQPVNIGRTPAPTGPSAVDPGWSAL